MDLYHLNSDEKLDKVVNDAWKLFICKFLNNRFYVTTEAPFQHHFANIIKSVGEQHCFARTETFVVDLETRIDNMLGKTKFVDITFCFYDKGEITAQGAMELKFKKKSQGADDFARIDSYVDIESLEECLERGYNNTYFCMIADNSIYTRQSAKGTTGDIFSMRNGYTNPINTQINNQNCKGKKDVVVTLKYPHTFSWEEIGGYYFLLLPINKR